MKKNVRIVPAILTDDPQALEKLVRQTEQFTDYAQMDVMDGDFVPSRSVSCAQIAAVKPDLHWEAHLMVRHPCACLGDFQQAGAEKIVFHHEATPTPRDTVREIRKLGMQAGLAVNPETPIDTFGTLVPELDSVLFLAVNPGYYGSPFIPEVLNKIVEFRQLYPDIETGIDGGVKEDNIMRIAGTGVDVIYVGSAIFRQSDPAASFHRLQSLVTESSQSS